MVKPVLGTRQPGGPFIRAALLMTLINVSPGRAAGAGQASGVVFI